MTLHFFDYETSPKFIQLFKHCKQRETRNSVEARKIICGKPLQSGCFRICPLFFASCPRFPVRLAEIVEPILAQFRAPWVFLITFGCVGEGVQ
jgi:hypothetical protein